MFGANFRWARPGQSNHKTINKIAREVAQARNLRPGTGLGAISTPFGTATTLSNLGRMVAYTDGGGVGNATVNGAGDLQLGVGNASPALMALDDADVPNVVLTYKPNQTNWVVPVYNLDSGSTPVAGNTWVIIEKFYGYLWVVTWELCPDGTP